MVAFKINRVGQGYAPPGGACRASSSSSSPSGAQARSPRRRVLLTGTFHSVTSSHQACVRNLSCTGASVSCDAPVKVGTEGVLQAGGLDALCRVIWRKGDVFGLRFDKPLHTALVLEMHRVTEQDVKRAETQAAKEWFEAQAR